MKDDVEERVIIKSLDDKKKMQDFYKNNIGKHEMPSYSSDKFPYLLYVRTKYGWGWDRLNRSGILQGNEITVSEFLDKYDTKAKEKLHAQMDADDVEMEKFNHTLTVEELPKHDNCIDDLTNTTSKEWSDKHYNFTYKLSEHDIESGEVKIDPYFVYKLWELHKVDKTGILFHNLKTIARFGSKNSIQREIDALEGQIKRLKELEYYNE